MTEQSTKHISREPQRDRGTDPKIGIALGAGGAKGIAHVPMLEAQDDLGITPHRIAGSSIGAIMGALYASGKSAAKIKDTIAHLAITKSDTFQGVFADQKFGKWMAMIDADFHNSGQQGEPGSMPGYFDTLFGSIQIMQAALVDREIKMRPPDIHIQPELHGIRTLQFHRADEIYRLAQPAKEELKQRLEESMETWKA